MRVSPVGAPIWVNRESAIGTRVHWDPPESGTPYRFIIESKRDDPGWHTAGGVSGLKTTYQINGQAPDHQYQYRVRAQNDVGIRGPAGPASNDPMDIPAKPHQWPHVPGNLAIHMVNSDTVQLYWNAPTERGGQVTSYRFRRILVRWDKSPGNYIAFLHFACALIALRAAGLSG